MMIQLLHTAPIALGGFRDGLAGSGVGAQLPWTVIVLSAGSAVAIGWAAALLHRDRIC